MIIFIKKHIEKILIALGTIIIVFVIMYSAVNNNSSIINLEAVIGIALSYSLIVPGMWIASEKMKEKRKKLSIFIKVFTIIECLAFARYVIAFLFKC